LQVIQAAVWFGALCLLSLILGLLFQLHDLVNLQWNPAFFVLSSVAGLVSLLLVIAAAVRPAYWRESPHRATAVSWLLLICYILIYEVVTYIMAAAGVFLLPSPTDVAGNAEHV
jgi:hypothetical protein